MADTTVQINRRLTEPKDRRHATRGGRRAGERGRRWRHLGLLIAGYAMYVGVRTVTDRARGLLRRARQ